MSDVVTPVRGVPAVPPHRDRRRFAFGAIGVIGELMITLGVLLFGFLVWQLWWTDIVGNEAQAQVVTNLDFTPAPTGSAGAPIVAPERHDDPPVLTEPALTTTFATLQIPRWTAEGEPVRPVSEGTDKKTVLDALGIGHYAGTVMPGAIGNFAVAGHRTTYAKPFNKIDQLQVGDAIVLRTADTWYVYTVTGSEIARPNDVDVIAAVPDQPGATPAARMITLTSCHPPLKASERFVVHGVLKYWAPTSSGTPAEVLGSGTAGQ